ncbi:AcrR family transcriptional regulator [Streptosporangium becharense]|uniref:AcrR family transcriptional regulator n=1 Tax=Streptosporangium becharense TaxID=1816182 RepID=A0A7W9IE94_9ACTN|nr:TetR/AcrR family transcriptional regulator [Streptosporangium becharense]MBB2915562.1 AcrR family transcriptional regulator [Streptosporangium becharense]MBB5818911.1 AcrR family transcriptional regulator [Streptosporangium becharense]
MDHSFGSVWTREPRAAKSPTLSRAQIVRAAVELLDAEGSEALSMRRLGARLGAGATSIYWHVANKDQLLELVLDEVYGELVVPDLGEVGWRDAVFAFAYAMRQAIFRHPWVTSIIGTTPALGPNAMRLTDRMLTLFAEAGFQGLDRDYAVSTITSYVTGVTTPEISWQAMMTRAGAGPDEMDAAIRPAVEMVAADYPALLAYYAEYGAVDMSTKRALNFEFGLTCLVDGLAARLERGPDAPRPGLAPRPPSAARSGTAPHSETAARPGTGPRPGNAPADGDGAAV